MSQRVPESLVAGSEAMHGQMASRRTLVIIAWVATLLLSKLPLVVAREFLNTDVPRIALVWSGSALLLLALTFVWPTLKPLRAFFVVMLAIVLMTAAVDLLLVPTAEWQRLVAGARPMVALFIWRIVVALEALIVLGALFLMGFRRRDVFLTIGDLNAPVTGIRLPNRTTAAGWAGFGITVTLLLAGLFFAFMATQNPGALSGFAFPPSMWILILASAALNAFGEEAMYRAAPLAPLHPVVGARHALWMTSIWFGLGHYYGGIPSGAFGFVLTGLLGLLLGKAMLDTRGMGWPWFIHAVLDTIIYCFIAAAAG